MGIMTVVSAASASTYGERAMIHGMNISFLCMAGGTLVLLLISIFAVRKKQSMK
ncbi:hypothetical protein [Eubacterium sp. An11]|uniref:hypothetical protein n=1 Tax=Eubacterium sp. An11 TaxID=1965542 RepID=UPI001FA84C8E|nr:hypothetical protein [Eubacterium sp. An11]